MLSCVVAEYLQTQASVKSAEFNQSGGGLLFGDYFIWHTLLTVDFTQSLGYGQRVKNYSEVVFWRRSSWIADQSRVGGPFVSGTPL